MFLKEFSKTTHTHFLLTLKVTLTLFNTNAHTDKSDGSTVEKRRVVTDRADTSRAKWS